MEVILIAQLSHGVLRGLISAWEWKDVV